LPAFAGRGSELNAIGDVKMNSSRR
jgi:hypothetical protein